MPTPPSALTHELWQQARSLFDEVADLDTGVREQHLDAYSGDPRVVAEVRSLLAWDEQSQEFMETPAVRVPDVAPVAVSDASLEGRELGPWRVLGLIGRGGMGAVYRAERADDAFTRQVALKVIRGGGDAARVVERFRLERETLASLDHRNIARLLDGGTTDEGRPYFVMEFVDGVAVDRYCDEHRLPVIERLELFRRICAGVQYAHENLVVHRDIKPDNVLVSRDGTPKLLDFGVAKITSRVGGAVDGPELAATWLMTPEFASPEQLAGHGGGMASDIYSLGVLLYVLLAGVRPYRLHGSTAAELRTQLSGTAVQPPSSRVRRGPEAEERAARRSTTAELLHYRLLGDLDAIILKAMAPEPEGRYSSVQALVQDLRDHLEKRPVSARQPTVSYLLGKYAARHRRRFLVGSIILGLTIGSTVSFLWQARIAAVERARAERRLEDVRRLANVFLFDVNDMIANVPGTMPARQRIVSTATEYLESLARESDRDPGLQRELAQAWVRVGDVQGNPSGPNLGDSAGALRSYQRALEFTAAVRQVVPTDPETARTVGLAHRRLADVLAWTGQREEALRESTTSEEEFRALAAAPGAPLADRLDAAVAALKQGDLLGNPNLPNLRRPEDAAARFQEALAALQALEATAPADGGVRRFLGLTWERIGTLHEAARRWPEAAAAYRQSFAIRKALAESEPGQLNVQRDLAVAYEKLGKVESAQGASDGGVANLRLALVQFERLAAADPADVNAVRSAAVSREVLATALAAAHQPGEARPLLEQALRVHEGLAARDPRNIQARCDVARLGEAIGDALAPAPARPAEAACARWRAAAQVLTSFGEEATAACSAADAAGRLSAKLVACR